MSLLETSSWVKCLLYVRPCNYLCTAKVTAHMKKISFSDGVKP